MRSTDGPNSRLWSNQLNYPPKCYLSLSIQSASSKLIFEYRFFFIFESRSFLINISTKFDFNRQQLSHAIYTQKFNRNIFMLIIINEKIHAFEIVRIEFNFYFKKKIRICVCQCVSQCVHVNNQLQDLALALFPHISVSCSLPYISTFNIIISCQIMPHLKLINSLIAKYYR